jgi:hypothetical protein
MVNQQGELRYDFARSVKDNGQFIKIFKYKLFLKYASPETKMSHK